MQQQRYGELAEAMENRRTNAMRTAAKGVESDAARQRRNNLIKILTIC